MIYKIFKMGCSESNIEASDAGKLVVISDAERDRINAIIDYWFVKDWNR